MATLGKANEAIELITKIYIDLIFNGNNAKYYMKHLQTELEQIKLPAGDIEYVIKHVTDAFKSARVVFDKRFEL